MIISCDFHVGNFVCAPMHIVFEATMISSAVHVRTLFPNLTQQCFLENKWPREANFTKRKPNSKSWVEDLFFWLKYGTELWSSFPRNSEVKFFSKESRISLFLHKDFKIQGCSRTNIMIFSRTTKDLVHLPSYVPCVRFKMIAAMILVIFNRVSYYFTFTIAPEKE